MGNEYKTEGIYLDSSATSFVIPEVLEAMLPYLTGDTLQGNPSSRYLLGETARKAVSESREIIASAIGAEPSEIYFTSGGSEANNWVIKGLKNRYRFKPSHIISSTIEHHSITESLKYRWNEQEDIEYNLVHPGRDGVISVESITDMFKLNTVLVSIMYVNNEIGTIQPISQIAEKCSDNGIVMHTDAVQAFGKMPIDVSKEHIAVMSMAGHKICGPKGVGALYISNDIKGLIHPFVHGGHQERNMRAGTENVAAIVGFGKATEIAVKNMAANARHEQILRDCLLEQIKNIQGVHLNGDICHMDPRHVNIRIDGIRAEELLSLLDSAGIYVSSGSACNSESKEPSHVLKSIGLTDGEANSSIRISISENNTEQDINTFILYLKEYISVLRGEQ